MQLIVLCLMLSGPLLTNPCTGASLLVQTMCTLLDVLPNLCTYVTVLHEGWGEQVNAEGGL